MALTLADVGADVILKAFFNNSRAVGGNNFKLKLFVNDVTPTQTSTAGTFTEAAGGGYVAGGKALTNGSWTVTVGNDPSDATYAIQTWTFTGALTTNPNIYGYYLTDADDVLIYAERLGTMFTPANNGDQLSVTQKFQLSSGTPA